VSVITRSALVRHSQEQMFRLVFDVPKYHEFLPWCSGGRFLREEAKDCMVAELDIDYKGFRQSFATRNQFVEFSSIHLMLEEGPFRHLDGKWLFTALEDGASKVELTLDFAFDGMIMRTLLTPVFEHIGATMVDAFVARASDVYG
jgi:ribosome-associated toxin RatA of RatAB toxin-antitoxin module